MMTLYEQYSSIAGILRVDYHLHRMCVILTTMKHSGLPSNISDSSQLVC